MRFFITWVATAWLGFSALGAVSKSHTAVDLLLSAKEARPGDTVLAAIRLRMEPKWHTYWRNPGDAGGATEVEWQLPIGVTAGEIQWPAPERLDEEGLTTFVYHDEVTLLVPISISPDTKPGPVELKAKVKWLECAELCLPGSADVSANLVVGSETRPSANAAVIEAAKAKLPQPGTALGLMVAWEAPPTNNRRNLLFDWPATKGVTAPDFFPITTDNFEAQLNPKRLPVDASRIAMRMEVKSLNGKWPTNIQGIIVQTVDGKGQSFDVNLVPKGVGTGLSLSPTGPSSNPDTGITAGDLLKYLLFSLVGGLILNLMPCVLPILSLKVLHIVKHQGTSPGQARKHALVYTFGVLVCFWSIAGLVMAGRLTSWGGQFQSSSFVVIMAVLMTLVGLNLFGVFEVALPGQALAKAGELAGKTGVSGAFFNGLLAVVLGASCVAPILTQAIGWAVRRPPLIILLSFSMIGIGLALPFVLISFFPPLRKLLPKPGAWMEKFKILMGFPMLATAAWLLAQTADHFGSRGPLWVGLFLVLLALASWVYGEFHQRGSKRRGLAMVIAIIIAFGGYAWTMESELDWRHPPVTLPEAESAAATEAAESGIAWHPWSVTAVEKARSEGSPVLVDFTANWCLTCQLNKKTSLEIDSVRQKLKQINAVALLGDYTRSNPEITAELNRFQRAGVPLVLVYPKDTAKPPQILPAVLTPAIVLDALDAAAK